MSSGPFDDDMGEMVQDDMQRFRDLQSKDMGSSVPALMELVFGGLTALVGIVWLCGLFFLEVESTTWMGLGAAGAAIFGLPAALLYAGRRGGVEIVQTMVRNLIRS